MKTIDDFFARLRVFAQKDAQLFKNLPVSLKREALSNTMMFFDAKQDIRFRRIASYNAASAHEHIAAKAYIDHWHQDGQDLNESARALLAKMSKTQGLWRSEMTLSRNTRGEFSLSFYISRFLDIQDKLSTQTFNWREASWIEEATKTIGFLASTPLKGKIPFRVSLAPEWIVSIYSDSAENAALKAVMCFKHLGEKPDGFFIDGCAVPGADLLAQAFARKP